MNNIQVDLTSESNKVLSSIDPIHRHSAINLGLSLLSKTSIYRNFYRIPTEAELTTIDDTDIQSLSEVIMIDNSVKVDAVIEVKSNITQLHPRPNNSSPLPSSSVESVLPLESVENIADTKLVIDWDKPY